MTGVTGTDLLLQVYAWLPTAFFLDFLVAGTLIAVARRRHARGATRSADAARMAEDAQGGAR